MTPKPPFTDVETAMAEIRAGRMIVVVDDEDRENEGDLTMAAEKVTPEAINFMAKYGRGLICLAMTPDRLDYLRLKPMTSENTCQFGTAFVESIDAVGRGVTTGISSYDRAQTILCAIDPATRPSDLARPGHMFPLRARNGGVLVRGGQTEASVDLTRMAGMVPAGVICEIMKEDGTMARVPDLIEFCGRHGMKMLTVAELIRYRMAYESYVHRVGESVLATEHGDFRVIAYSCNIDDTRHIAMVRGDVEGTGKPVLVRMHRHCLAGDIFGSTGCECGNSLRASLNRIAEEGGALVYLHQNSVGFSVEKVGDVQTLSFDQEANDSRSKVEYQRWTQRQLGIGAQILSDLKLRRIRLLTNHPRRMPGIDGYGIEIVEYVSIPGQVTAACKENATQWNRRTKAAGVGVPN
jgi:3,4-dihydroxy 2-butanone 4-phosphate synthase/GTP cyclohydrolase II